MTFPLSIFIIKNFFLLEHSAFFPISFFLSKNNFSLSFRYKIYMLLFFKTLLKFILLYAILFSGFRLKQYPVEGIPFPELS